jgi:hypothetical protein
MKHLFAAQCLLAVLLPSSGTIVVQTTTGPSGHWEGSLQVPGQELRIEIDLANKDDKWEGTIAIPAQSLKGFPLSAISVKAEAVTFALNGVPGEPRFNGTLSKDGKSLSGDFTQGGGTIPFSVTRTGEPKIEAPPKSTAITKDLEGSWEGALNVNGTTLRLVFKLSNRAEGTATASVVSVDQGGVEIPAAAVVQTGSHLKIVVRQIAGSYEGDLKDGLLTGTWTQGPGTLPLVLKRASR